ncbi:MAG: hypothetical protein Q8K02_02905 [Flavobacterium sp.]|nr:hypothetical protein [Flavobacterium sp.]
MKNIIILFIGFFFFNNILYSQNKTIKGRIITEDFDILRGVTIIVNDSIEVGKTDIKGFFEIDIPILVNKLTFDFVGLETVTIHLIENCDNVDLIMMYDVTYDFIPLKRVDIKRKKRHKKLEKVYCEAFKKGLFESKEPCYNRYFEPFYE